MKTNVFLLILLSFFSCKENTKKTDVITPVAKQSIQPYFQNILDSAEVSGAILLFDEYENIFYSNDFDYVQKGKLPASTFKIPNSLIALETGTVKDTNTIMPWDGVERDIRIWNEDMPFKEAFHRSCVPCYQDIARRVGVDTMQHYLKLLQFGQMDVNTDNLDMFWLTGESKISPYQQIAFLQSFYKENILLSKRTYDIAKKMMLVEDTPSYKILAKTGRTFENNNSWYVGYVEKGEKVYYFAINFFPKGDFDFRSRKGVTMAALKSLDIIPPSVKRN